jgi:beta-lactamase regulating signal transducer with metallopeptidase domain
MIVETLASLVQINLALAGAVLLVVALRDLTRLWFGARAAYLLWWAAPVAIIATMLPSRAVEIIVAAPAPQAVGTPAIAAMSTLSAQLPTMTSVDTAAIVLCVWIAGTVAMLMVLMLRQRAFVGSLGELRRDPDGSLRAEASCGGPIILGALRPRLVLPRDFETRFDTAERELMLAHERVHLKRRDPAINGLAVLIRSVCWFNPLAHVATSVMRTDQELACDATVTQRYPRARRAYAEAMLKAQLVPMNLPIGCAWSARGAHPLRLRIAMLKRGLPAARRAAAGSLMAALISVTTGCAAWMTQPPREIVTKVDSIADTQLLRAALSGNARRAESAIRAGADVNMRSKNGLTVLTVAARAEDMRMLNLLLDHGADVHLRSPREGNALIAAGRRGHLHAVAALIEHGATVNEVVPEYGTPLVASVRTGHFEVVKYLVEHGADVNLASPLQAPWDRWGVTRTPLEVAIGGDHTPTINYLRSVGATM